MNLLDNFITKNICENYSIGLLCVLKINITKRIKSIKTLSSPMECNLIAQPSELICVKFVWFLTLW